MAWVWFLHRFRILPKQWQKGMAQELSQRGLYAQYQLGLTQQIPMNIAYLTDGVSRTINLGEGKNIKFKRASPRYFSIRSRLALLLTTALKDWKVENLTDEQVATIKMKLNENPHLQVADLKLMPSKVREFIVGLYE